MKERPILFSAPMVRAILDGRKTQTRRVVKGRALEWLADVGFTPDYVAHPENHMCPYGQTGDRLWVRETFHADEHGTRYKASGHVSPMGWKPSIHMPRKASRIDLEITGVRVERLQDISEEDAMAEGLETDRSPLGKDWTAFGDKVYSCPRAAFRSLWQSINGPESWKANPWVWVVEFRRAA